MLDYLSKKFGFVEGPLLGNSLTEWLIAAGLAFAVWGALWIVRKFIASRYQRYSGAQNPTLVRLAAYPIGKTKQILFLAIAIYAAQEWLTLPPKVEHVVSNVVLVLILLQVGLWAGRT